MSSGKKWDTAATHTHRLALQFSAPRKRGKLITHFKKMNPPALLHLLNKTGKRGGLGGEG